jgi:hypothetical protein
LVRNLLFPDLLRDFLKFILKKTELFVFYNSTNTNKFKSRDEDLEPLSNLKIHNLIDEFKNALTKKDLKDVAHFIFDFKQLFEQN